MLESEGETAGGWTQEWQSHTAGPAAQAQARHAEPSWATVQYPLYVEHSVTLISSVGRIRIDLCSYSRENLDLGIWNKENC